MNTKSVPHIRTGHQAAANRQMRRALQGGFSSARCNFYGLYFDGWCEVLILDRFGLVEDMEAGLKNKIDPDDFSFVELFLVSGQWPGDSLCRAKELAAAATQHATDIGVPADIQVGVMMAVAIGMGLFEPINGVRDDALINLALLDQLAA